MTTRPRLLVVTTSPVTPWGLMRGQLRYLGAAGYEVTLVSAPGPLLDASTEREGVRAVGVPMHREISPVADLRALRALLRVFRTERPDVSLVSTPKAGLLAGVAAWLTRVPTRVYVLRGLRLETARGGRRVLLWVLEWVAVHAARQVVVVSPSLLARSRALHLLGRRRGVVLGRGASNGVDLDRFATTPETRARGRELRRRLGLPDGSFVFGFVGRLTPDKGVAELVEALDELPAAWLLVVGSGDGEGPLPAGLRDRLAGHPRVRSTGWLDDPAVGYQAMDALVLPTHREGFPNVPLEAAAAGKPVVTTNATGAVDSVIDGVTGYVTPVGDPPALAKAMRQLAEDPAGAAELGAAGRAFVAEHFANERVWRNLAAFLDAQRVG